MASVNKVILIGNLGRDPEMRHMPNGDAALAAGDSLGARSDGARRADVDAVEHAARRRRMEMTKTRPCTCAPDERTFPCQHQYALALCRKAEILALRAALFQAQEAAKALLAKGEMLAAVVQGAKEDFVRATYGASHEDVAAINDWHKMAAEALSEWENKA